MSDRKEIGQRIASARGFKRMSQEALGESVGVSKQTISGWETGWRTPDGEKLSLLCVILDCSADYLLGLSDDLHGHYARYR